MTGEEQLFSRSLLIPQMSPKQTLHAAVAGRAVLVFFDSFILRSTHSLKKVAMVMLAARGCMTILVTWQAE